MSVKRYASLSYLCAGHIACYPVDSNCTYCALYSNETVNLSRDKSVSCLNVNVVSITYKSAEYCKFRTFSCIDYNVLLHPLPALVLDNWMLLSQNG